jgi:hypothetical protein
MNLPLLLLLVASPACTLAQLPPPRADVDYARFLARADLLWRWNATVCAPGCSCH